MKCESCNAILSSAMRGALRANSCPFCSGNIMGDQKAEQYYNLLEVLDNTTFTNRSDVDSQIKEKVASLMINNFVFMKLNQTEDKDDIIVVDDDVPSHQVVATASPQQTNSKKRRKKGKKGKLQTQSVSGKPLNTVTEDIVNDDSVPTRVPTPRPKHQISANAPVGKTGLTLADYQNAQNDTYMEVGSTPNVGADLTPDEIMKAFPGLTPEEAVQALQKEADMLQRSGPQKGLTGKGIKRLNG